MFLPYQKSFFLIILSEKISEIPKNRRIESSWDFDIFVLFYSCLYFPFAFLFLLFPLLSPPDVGTIGGRGA